jgi:prepilin-type N-terminal cleavage/methylation domain-containing protein
MNTPRRQAFTLVELLVVITIIGMLVALLLPAVNSARQAAQQTTCSNNQQEYGKAIQQYIVNKDYFPFYRSFMSPSLTAPGNFTISWQIPLLPNLGKADLYDALQRVGVGTPLPFIGVAVCPSDNTVSGRTDPATSYVVNTGRLDASSGSDVATGGIPNGLFFDGCFLPANSPSKIKVALTDIRDGQNHTLMLSENVDAHFYSQNQTVSLSGSVPNRSDIDKATNCTERATGFVYWWDTTPSSGKILAPPKTAQSPSAVIAINKERGDHESDLTVNPTWSPYRTAALTAASQNYAARPSSYHSGGVVVTFAAGNTTFLSESIDYDVYCTLMTPRGTKFDLPEPTLSEDAY